jgi:hypothetical protein
MTTTSSWVAGAVAESGQPRTKQQLWRSGWLARRRERRAQRLLDAGLFAQRVAAQRNERDTKRASRPGGGQPGGV